ncbi:hypothetical protein SY83_12830 [Paenibacillus swuensis]|uniref:Copper amine oxidase-like N-terminal domain-containing protein n=1 Tax=Paenibacillus swuensis TaxID=1178515 RepID=A0A172TIZ8_9BACL|nr:copper amine oxidase N-terminal domain-containing protein [Paenibacillus swuensis]ANE47008.1 hypothetical protein SY83_12830 [Paenibacillus swuensis]
MRTKFTALLTVLALISSVFFGLSSALAADSKYAITADAEVQAQIDAFAAIKKMFDDSAPLADIKAKYEEKFKTQVAAIDATIAEGNPKINDNVLFFLDAAVKGDMNAAQAKQAVDKGLQWYFYFLTKSMFSKQVRPALEAKDTAKAKVELEKAIQIYEQVLEPTVVKRDAKFKTKMQDELATVVIPSLQKDVAAGDLDNYKLHYQMYDKTLIKMFSYAALTYAEVSPTKPVADQPAAMTEGYFFFSSVYSYLKGGSAADADYILKAFATGKASELDLAKIKTAMNRAMIGKVREYVLKAADYASQGKSIEAQVYAMEGNMFLAAQEVFISEKLGADAYTAAVLNGVQFAKAIAANDVKTAQAHTFQVMKTLAKLNGLSFIIGTKSVEVNGVKNTITNASFANAKTNRTLVPTRYAELLGATVTFQPTTKKIVINYNGTTTELLPNEAAVTVNGEVNAEKKLDQPVVALKGVSYIPMRAVANLIGYEAFYAKGEVLIVK